MRVIQLDLFTDYSKQQRSLDLLIENLANQAANIRYLITRIQNCYDLPVFKRVTMVRKFEEVLISFRALCNKLKVTSAKHYHTDFNKSWLINEYVNLAESVDLEDIVSHIKNIKSCYKSAIVANKALLGKFGPIVDALNNKLISNPKYQYA